MMGDAVRYTYVERFDRCRDSVASIIVEGEIQEPREIARQAAYRTARAANSGEERRRLVGKLSSLDELAERAEIGIDDAVFLFNRDRADLWPCLIPSREERIRAVRAVTRKMPREQQRLAWMVGVGWTERQIAETEGVTQQAVSRRWHRFVNRFVPLYCRELNVPIPPNYRPRGKDGRRRRRPATSR